MCDALARRSSKASFLKASVMKSNMPRSCVGRAATGAGAKAPAAAAQHARVRVLRRIVAHDQITILYLPQHHLGTQGSMVPWRWA